MFWQLKDERQKTLAITDSAGEGNYDFDRIRSDVESLSSALSLPHKGIAAVFCDNSYNSVIAYLAVLNSGNTALLINAATDRALASNIIDCYKPELIIAAATNGYHFDSYTLKSSFGETLPIYECRETDTGSVFEDTALLLSTSGTTGNPKLVRLSYKNLSANASSIAEYLSVDSNETAITSLPMSYSFGLSVINSHILTGAHIVCSNDTVMQKNFWTTFRENNCTSFAGVPYSYEMLLRLRFGTMNLPSLRTMTQAGGKLSKENILKFEAIAKEKGFRFFVMYGQTEATARIAYVPFEKQPEKAGSAGIAIPGGKLAIVDDNRILPPNETGELVYSGPNVMLGYAETRADLAKGDEQNGVLRTGDVGYLDNDGYLYITGRLKRFSKVLGQRINLDDIERLIREKLDLASACLQNDDLIEIFVESGEESTVKQTVDLVSNAYSLHHSLVDVRLTSAIAYTSSGKKDYKTMKEQFRQ